MGAALRSRAALALALAAVLAGCGEDADSGEAERPRATTRTASSTTTVPAPVAALPDPPPCIERGSGCEQASGRILYVERVDPDGDGDAHFVLASEDSITAPGISVIDVRTELRPDPLPGPGDTLAASGPVFPGSYGQSQIQADAVVVGEPAGAR